MVNSVSTWLTSSPPTMVRPSGWRSSEPVPLPSISGSRTPANLAGWNNTDVEVTFACADGLSGVIFCGPSVTLSAEGAGQVALGSAQDRADNLATATVSGINIDKTAPYMHNGALDTLEQVIDFYDRGPEALGYRVPNLDVVLASGPIGLSDTEKRQLLTFLREGLTDLSGTPAYPPSVPSGLKPGGTPPAVD